MRIWAHFDYVQKNEKKAENVHEICMQNANGTNNFGKSYKTIGDSAPIKIQDEENKDKEISFLGTKKNDFLTINENEEMQQSVKKIPQVKKDKKKSYTGPPRLDDIIAENPETAKQRNQKDQFKKQNAKAQPETTNIPKSSQKIENRPFFRKLPENLQTRIVKTVTTNLRDKSTSSIGHNTNDENGGTNTSRDNPLKDLDLKDFKTDDDQKLSTLFISQPGTVLNTIPNKNSQQKNLEQTGMTDQNKQKSFRNFTVRKDLSTFAYKFSDNHGYDINVNSDVNTLKRNKSSSMTERNYLEKKKATNTKFSSEIGFGGGRHTNEKYTENVKNHGRRKLEIMFLQKNPDPENIGRTNAVTQSNFKISNHNQIHFESVTNFKKNMKTQLGNFFLFKNKYSKYTFPYFNHK